MWLRGLLAWKGPWTNEAAEELLAVVRQCFPAAKMNYLKTYIGISVCGHNYLCLHKQNANKSLLECWVGERHVASAGSLLDSGGISYTVKRNRTVIMMTVDTQNIAQNADLLKQFAEIVGQAWTS